MGRGFLRLSCRNLRPHHAARTGGQRAATCQCEQARAGPLFVSDLSSMVCYALTVSVHRVPPHRVATGNRHYLLCLRKVGLAR